MKTGESRPGTVPGYLPESDASVLADVPIGDTRMLSLSEETDMLAAGFTRDQIVMWTPVELREIADMVVEQSELFVGS